MIEWFWRRIAALAVRHRDRLINYALKHPYTHIDKNGDVYMERYWLFNPYQLDGKKIWWRQLLPSARIHWIRRPDQDRHLHDHPWNARTIVLKNGYAERRQGELIWEDRRIVRRVGDTARIRFGEYHAIDEVYGDGAWTIFITWKYQGTWGFLVDGVKIPWRQYLAQAPGAQEIAKKWAQCAKLYPPCKEDCTCQADALRKEEAHGIDQS